MPTEKKTRYTDAQKKATEKYLKESVEDIRYIFLFSQVLPEYCDH